MNTVSYFIINDNNNPLHFHIEPTLMKDWRLRLSAMRSAHRRYLKKKGSFKTYFTLFEADHSVHLLEKVELDFSEIQTYLEKLITERKDRFKGSVPNKKSNIVTFN